MKMWRKILYAVMCITLSLLIILNTAELFSDFTKTNFLDWLQLTARGAAIMLEIAYFTFAKGEWAEKHPRGARIADICGWVGLALMAISIWIRLII